MVDYEQREKPGEGTYAVVFKAVHRITDDPVAVKTMIVDHECEGISPTGLRELAIL
jgi:cyclin-dependent kinase 2